MCGLIAVVNKENGKFPADMFKSVVYQAQIRGQHATGLAFDNADELVVMIKALPATNVDMPIELYDAKMAMCHTRYSTSNLLWNQPNYTEHTALIHNGVVTQADPEKWEELFGVECATGNDSEILLRLMEQGRHPLHLENTSQACVYMDVAKGQLKFWRNEQRPLYYLENNDFLLVASTVDIIHRLGINRSFDYVHRCEPCVEYTYDINKKSLSQEQVRIPSEDLQTARI